MMKNQIRFVCNNRIVNDSIHPGLSLLNYLRRELRLTGTKEGCREGDCGACTILIGELTGNIVKYHSVNSCLFPIGDANGKHIVTIEGLRGENLSLVQQSFIDEWASQCGFCTPGFVVSLTGYFLSNEKFDIDEAVESMDGNICRCTGHASIIRAARKSTELISSRITNHTDHVSALIKTELIPPYFKEIPQKLKDIKTQQLSEKEKTSPTFYISGGTDLFVQKWEDILNSEVKLLSSNGVSSETTAQNGKCIIGARATVSDVMNSQIITQYLPSFKEDLKLFGSLPIRNRATIGGNIVNASPIADMTNILLALNSILHLNSKRSLLLKDFYKGYKNLDLNKGELIENVSFDLPTKNSYFNFEKVSQRTYLDIASANSSIYLELNDGSVSKVQISAGGVAPIPLYLSKTSEYLIGKEINYTNISEATEIAMTEISPITDARGTAEYKSLLLRQLIFAHFIKLLPEKISIKEIA
jgi:xanthine dehydrogenase small subunit